MQEIIVTWGKREQVVNLQDGIFTCSGLEQCFVGEVIGFGREICVRGALYMGFFIGVYIVLLVLAFATSSTKSPSSSSAAKERATAAGMPDNSDPEKGEDDKDKKAKGRKVWPLVALIIGLLVAYVVTDWWTGFALSGAIVEALHSLYEWISGMDDAGADVNLESHKGVQFGDSSEVAHTSPTHTTSPSQSPDKPDVVVDSDVDGMDEFASEMFDLIDADIVADITTNTSGTLDELAKRRQRSLLKVYADVLQESSRQ